jgi:hypothetical protein
MNKTFVLASALSFALSGAAMAAVYTLDTQGKCRDDHGMFAKQTLCAKHMYKLDSKGKCRDEHGRFADGKFCHA